MRFIEDIAYGLHPSQKLDVYLPDAETFPVYVHIHGGGFENGSKADCRTIAEYLTEYGIAVVAPEYRMYPDAAYPDYLRDSASAVAWAYKKMGEYGANGRLFVGGTSAGGYASMMLCFDKRWLAPHKLPKDAITGYFHDAGQPTVHFNIMRERGLDSRRIMVDEAAPLYHIGEDPEYPPMHFLVSDNDIPCRYEQIMTTMATMKYLGYDMDKVTWQLMHGTHCWYYRRKDENGVSLMGPLIRDFIEKH